MTWRYNEIVRAGNSTAKVKNYYPETGLLVLYFIQGGFENGSTIVGDESGETLVVSEFTVNFDYDMNYEPTHWDDVIDDVVYDGLGNMVALEEHFTGLPSQDFQVTYLVVRDRD